MYSKACKSRTGGCGLAGFAGADVAVPTSFAGCFDADGRDASRLASVGEHTVHNRGGFRDVLVEVMTWKQILAD